MFIEELHILSDDLDKTAHFYSEELGMPITEKTDEHIKISIGQSDLIFHISHESPHYHFAFNIPGNKINEALNWIKGKVNVISLENGNQIADFRNWNAEALYFLDNNGNIIELIARKDLLNNTEQPFGSSQLLSVSEIGIVTADVLLECQALILKYGIYYFDKQPPTQHFAALGDDDGLFIVVSKSRNWYPTTIPSSMHWLKVIFRINSKSCELQW